MKNKIKMYFETHSARNTASLSNPLNLFMGIPSALCLLPSAFLIQELEELKKDLARKHLKVSRQRKDFAVKTARCVVQSNDLVAYEDLKVRNMVSQRVGRVSRLEATGEPVRVRNRHLAKSISDAAWTQFRSWVEYFGRVFGVVTVAVPPHYTSQNCSNCGRVVKKTLSTRTHTCLHCGHVQDRDHNAARNILEKGLSTVGHIGTNASGENDLCLGVRPWRLPFS